MLAGQALLPSEQTLWPQFLNGANNRPSCYKVQPGTSSLPKFSVPYSEALHASLYTHTSVRSVLLTQLPKRATFLQGPTAGKWSECCTAVLDIEELRVTAGFMEDLAFCIGSPIRQNIRLY